jgi:DNA-binding response OmpR family regulator
MAHILLVDDDTAVLRALTRVLERSSYSVSSVTSGTEAWKLILQQRPDLLILDIMMPRMNGIEVCRRVRADPYVAKMPILFLTAKGQPTDIAQGLDAGADDYLVKPFKNAELPARIRALLRRAPGGPLDPESDVLVVGDLRLHARRFELCVDDQTVYLTAIEHQLMYYLMLHAGRPISAAQLLQDVWQYPPGTGDPILVRVHIGNIRAKIEPSPARPRYIVNVRGRGYALVG